MHSARISPTTRHASPVCAAIVPSAVADTVKGTNVRQAAFTGVPFTVSSAVKGTLDAHMADACTVDGDQTPQEHDPGQARQRVLRARS